MGGIGVQDLPLTERNSRLTFGLMRKRPIEETKFEDKLDVEVKLNKRTEETAGRQEPD